MTSPNTTSTSGAAAVPAGGGIAGLAFGTWLPVLAVFAVLGFALMSSGYFVTVIGFAAIYGIFCTGLNFFMGYTGQASFGQNAFAALGGYGTAILCAGHGWEPLPALPRHHGVLRRRSRPIVGYPTLRLRGHYLAMATFALGLITYELSIEWIDLTQGYMGYAGIPPLGIGGLRAHQREAATRRAGARSAVRRVDRRRACATRASAAPCAPSPAARRRRERSASTSRATSSRPSWSPRSTPRWPARCSRTSSASSRRRCSALAMVILSFTMLYLGGIGTTWGPVIGAVIVSMLPEFLRGLKELQDIAYAVVLVLILIFCPKGIVGAVRLAPAGAAADREGGVNAMALLSVREVTKRFGGLLANDAISFDVEEGALFAVIGPNGAGKTTLFNAISGFFAPTEGRIAFAGEDITGMPQHEIAARGLVRTYQLVQLFKDLTVAENVQVGFHLVTKGAIGAALFRPALGARSRRPSIRDKTERTARLRRPRARRPTCSADKLPYGQQRLLEVARALAAEPRLLLLDEPAAGLNTQETEALAEIIEQRQPRAASRCC